MLEGITNVTLGDGTVYCLKPVTTDVIIKFPVAIGRMISVDFGTTSPR